MPSGRRGAGLAAMDLLDPVRLKHLLTDRTFLRVSRPLALAVALVTAEPPVPPKGLAAVVACLAGLFRIVGTSPPAGLAAKDDAAARLGRDCAFAPQAFPPLPRLDPFCPFQGAGCRASAMLVAVFAPDRAVRQRLSAPGAGQSFVTARCTARSSDAWRLRCMCAAWLVLQRRLQNL